MKKQEAPKTFRIKPTILAKMQRIAVKEDRSLNYVLNSILEKALK